MVSSRAIGLIFICLAVTGCDKTTDKQQAIAQKSSAVSANSSTQSAFWQMLTADTDSDGVYNWIEYLAGTDPEDNASKPLDSDNDSVFDVFVGPKGKTGPQGQKGDKGDTGENGEKGDKGDTGEKGEKGNTGDTGPTGPQGLTGTAGSQGPQGQKGDTGSTGPAGKDGKDYTKTCPAGSTSYYINSQLVYCVELVSLSSATWMKCLSECAKSGLSIALSSDLALVCAADSSAFSAYAASTDAYVALADYSTEGLQGSVKFTPGFYTDKPANDGVKRNFCEAMQSSNAENSVSYYFAGSTSSSVSGYYAVLDRTKSQYFSAPDSQSLSITGDITIEAWIKLEQLPSAPDTDFNIVDKIAANQRAWSWKLRTNNKLVFAFNGVADASTETAGTGGTAFGAGDVGVWRHVAVAVDVSAPSMTFYKNGVAMTTSYGTTTATSIADTTAKLSIGAWGEGSEGFFDGKIDEVRVWNDIRTASEIANNYNKELVGTESGLAGYWKFNNSLLDETSNNNTLTAHNSAAFSTLTSGQSWTGSSSAPTAAGCACGKRP